MTKLIQQKFSNAKTLEANGRYADAEVVYAELENHAELAKNLPQEIRARRRRTECLMRLQRWDEAAEEVATVLASKPARNNDIKRWLSVSAQLGEGAQPTDPVSEYARVERTGGKYPEGEYILLTAAAPKTGSTSLSVALAAAIDGVKVNYLIQPPTARAWGMPWMPALDALQGCALVNHCHLSPDAGTVAQIAARPWLRVVVHLRNPIETIESTIDMVIRQRSPNLLSAAPHLAHAPDEDLRAFVLTTYLPKLAEWMASWLALADAGHPAVLGVSTMDEMRARGQDALAARLVSDLPGLTPVAADTAPQCTGKRLNGDKAVCLTPAEANTVRASMPVGLLERFNWS